MRTLLALTPLFLFIPLASMAMVGAQEGQCTIIPKGGATRDVAPCTLTEGTFTAACSFASIDYCDDSGPNGFELSRCVLNEATQEYKQINNVRSEDVQGNATIYVLKDGTVILFKETGIAEQNGIAEQEECLPRKHGKRKAQ